MVSIIDAFDTATARHFFGYKIKPFNLSNFNFSPQPFIRRKPYSLSMFLMTSTVILLVPRSQLTITSTHFKNTQALHFHSTFRYVLMSKHSYFI